MRTVHRELVSKDPAGYEIWRETSVLPTYTAEEIHKDGDDSPQTQEVSDTIEQFEAASGQQVTIEVCYTPNGHYIGDEETAQFLCKEKGIEPELADGKKVCAIGFCQREQTWYGWSHRAIHGFGIGSEVKRGDCAYQPTDKEDFRLDCLRFWSDDCHEQTWAVADERALSGELGVLISWRYDHTIKNEKLRGKISGQFNPYPDSWGKGEWAATTLAEAREMAVDFAEGVG